MNTTKKRRSLKSYPTYKEDMKALSDIYDAYSNCEDAAFKTIWKQKWYELVSDIAKRVEAWRGPVDKSCS